MQSDHIAKFSRMIVFVVIAHQLSTVRNAQRVIGLTENGIDEQGTHEELIEWSLYKLIEDSIKNIIHDT
ncbi:MAG: hypothetical protein H0W88_01900 [Parachlamydiaceae bacterium]|nr:hypothetical protein [Parachlamydiaceae bacterium]